SLAARDISRIGLLVRRVGRQRQRETENVRRKVSADFLARHAAADKEDAHVGLPGTPEDHVLEHHAEAVVELIVGGDSQYPQHRCPVHSQPHRRLYAGNVRSSIPVRSSRTPVSCPLWMETIVATGSLG